MKKMWLGVLAFFIVSCTHFIIDTETRIQVFNGTDEDICKLSLLSSEEKIKVLVEDTVAPNASSIVYEHELTGEFNFVIFVGDSMKRLGIHELKGGSVEAQITKEGDILKMLLK